MQHIDLSLFGRKRVQHVRQTEIAECGLACIAMIAGFHGYDVDLRALRAKFSPSMRGTSIKSLMRLADRLGLSSRPVKLPLEALIQLQTPAILHWDMNHYVVLEQANHASAVILNPATGNARRMSLSEVSQHFTGVALELTPTADFQPVQSRIKFRFSDLWTRLRGWKRAATQALILTIVLQAFVLAMPFYLQLGIDNVIPSGDENLLGVMALGFGVITIFNGCASLLRSFVLLNSGTTIGFNLASNLARRLIRLPVTWFERRSVADVMSRFQSIRPIQDALTQGLVAAMVDGVLAIITLALMCFYSFALSTLAMMAFLLYALIRLISLTAERNANEAIIISSSKEQSVLMETIRGITPLRLFGRETERHVLWQNRLVDATNASVSGARTKIWYETSNTVLFGIENVASIWLALKFVLHGGFSIGMLVAYFSYKQLFLSRASKLIDEFVSFKLLGLHLDRLGDIAVEEEDKVFLESLPTNREFAGQIELKGVYFRYSDSDPLVLDDIELIVPAGSHIAITGASGGGKSTLAKIILGLSQPNDGELLVDGILLSKFGYRAYRSQIAAVLQSDSLFAGSIADNIALFDENADLADIKIAALQAAIHNDIEAMPMKYETLVGDMGSTLSGGQKARILLARALFQKPKLLLLDEGTAHLDAATEMAVNEAIQDLGITRIVIAHRRETIEAADQVVVLSNGKICQEI